MGVFFLGIKNKLSGVFLRKQLLFLLLEIKKNCQRRPASASHTGVFFLFGVIRIITCAGASRTDVFFLGLKNNCPRRLASAPPPT